MCSLYHTAHHNSNPTELECGMSSLRSENREPHRSFLRDTPRPFVRTCVRVCVCVRAPVFERLCSSAKCENYIDLWCVFEREVRELHRSMVQPRKRVYTRTLHSNTTYDPLKHRIGSDALCPSSHTNAQLSPDAVFEHVVAPSSMNSIPVGFEAQLRSHLEP